MRTAYKCRAYPDSEQASVLNRTFGCVRVVWNRTLAWRHARYNGEHVPTSFTQANAYLTAMKAAEDLDWLNEVSSVPLQQAIRHQQVAFSNFFAGRARYPRYKSRNGRQSAEYTRSGFRYRNGRLFLAKLDTPLAFTWSWLDIDPALETFPGLAGRKPEWLRSLALAALDGRLDAARLRAMPHEEAMADLKNLPGIGDFSAGLILLRGAGDPDAVAHREPRLGRAVALAYGLPGPATPEQILQISENWRPYRTWVTLLLRTQLEDETGEIAGRQGHARAR